jgi:hypothetical protein
MTSPSAAPSCSLLVGAACALQFQPGGEVSRHRHEDVASVEGGRDRMKPEVPVGELDRGLGTAERADGPRQQAVVGSDQNAASSRNRHRSPHSADAGVDDGNVNRRREVPDGLGEHCGATANVTGLNQMGDINDPRLWRDPGSNAVARRDETVLQTVVGQEAQILIDGHGC